MSGVNWAHKLKRMKETGEYQYASMAPHVNKRELIFKNCQLKQPQTKLLTVTRPHKYSCLSSVVLSQFGGHMNALCSRPDFLGRLGRHYLSEQETTTKLKQSPMTQRTLERNRQPRLSLRPLASYRTILLLLLFYVFGALLSFGPVSSTLLILTGGFLYGLMMTLFGDKLKTH